MRYSLVILGLAVLACGQEPSVPPPDGDPDPVIALRIVSPGSDHLLLGRTRQMEVTAHRRSGQVVAIDGRVAFQSTRPGALTVDSTGVVVAQDSGRAYITARVEIAGRTLRDSVLVVAVDPGFTVALAPALHALRLSQSEQISLTAQSRAGEAIPVPGPVRFRSTDPSVLTIDSTGLVSTAAMGNAFIVGEVTTPHGQIGDSLQIAVVCTSELEVSYDPPPNPLQVGVSFPLKVTLRGCGGQLTLEDELTWESADSLIVSVDNAGPTATARAPGQTTVSVTGKRFGRFGWMPVSVIP